MLLPAPRGAISDTIVTHSSTTSSARRAPRNTIIMDHLSRLPAEFLAEIVTDITDRDVLSLRWVSRQLHLGLRDIFHTRHFSTRIHTYTTYSLQALATFS